MDSDSHWTLAAAKQITDNALNHSKFDRAKKELAAAMWAAEPGEVIALVGPSRVGKSALLDLAGRHVREIYPGVNNPWVSVMAANAGRFSKFELKYCLDSCLKAIKHPIYGFSDPSDPYGNKLRRLIEKTSEPTLRSALMQAMVISGTLYLAIDEAHHIGHATGGNNTATQIFDGLKCLAAETGAVLILVSAYPLLKVLRLNAHMLGRKVTIHFPRYRRDVKEDCEEFVRILRTYDQILAGKTAFRSLVSEWEYLMDVTLGCLGHLSKILRGGLGYCQAESCDLLDIKHLKRAAHHPNDIKKILAEIDEGERDVKVLEGSASVSERKEPSEDLPATQKPKGEARTAPPKNRTFRPTQRHRKNEPRV